MANMENTTTMTLTNSIRNWPIGVFRYNLDNIWDNLTRNVGNFGESSSNGTPIGYMSDPYYTTLNVTPWFKKDSLKKNSPDYIEYIKATNRSDLSVKFSNVPIHWRDASSDYVGYRFLDSLDDTFKYIDSDTIKVSDDDTLLGNVSDYYVGVSMKNAYVLNSARVSGNKGISSDLKNFCGIKSEAEKEGNIFERFKYDKNTGRWLNTFHLYSSPIYNKEYQNIGLASGKFRNYYKLMNYTNNRTKAYIYGSIYGLDLDNEIGLDDQTKLDALFATLEINNYLGKNNSKYTFSKNYIETMINTLVSNVAINYTSDINGNVIRYHFNGIGNSNSGYSTKYTYGESQNQADDGQVVTKGGEYSGNFNEGLKNGGATTTYSSSIAFDDTTNDLINKTNSAFSHGLYRTLVSRFFNAGVDEIDPSDTNSAVDIWTHKYGISHGRNLLKKNPDLDNVDENGGYIDPYCRVWTNYHMYHRIQDLIRPFMDSEGNVVTQGMLLDPVKNLGNNWYLFGSQNKGDKFDNGRSRLGYYGVMNQNNGLINIAPVTVTSLKNHKNVKIESSSKSNVSVKQCMFSIENLAWKNGPWKNSRYTLSNEQIGPLGGRIMWFPPYGLKFNENTQASWNPVQFIGRGEPIYTYTNTTRSGNLNFQIIVDHPSVVDYWLFNHSGTSEDNTSIDGDEQTLLRFFAGCEILTPLPFTFNEEKEKKPATTETPNPSKTGKKIVLFVFYPNNYSGMDDAPSDTQRSVNAIQYLLNGVGSQIMVDSSGKLSDITTDANIEYKDSSGNKIGGYEMGNGSGISVLTSYPSFSKDEKTYEEGKGNLKYNRFGTPLTTVAYPQTTSSTQTIQLLTNYVNPNDYSKISQWCYRVDNYWAGQNFTANTNNYLDTKNYSMNATNGLDSYVIPYAKDRKFIDDSSDITVVSLADMYCALNTDAQNGTLSDKFSPNLVKKITDVLNSPKNITKITVEGDASAQGYGATAKQNWHRLANNVQKGKKDSSFKSPNEKLALERAKTVQKWLSSELTKRGVDSSIFAKVVVKTETKDVGDTTEKKVGKYVEGDVSNTSAKFGRHAMVTIEYTEGDEVVDAAASVSTTQNKNSTTVTPDITVTEYNSEYEKSFIENINTTNIQAISNGISSKYQSVSNIVSSPQKTITANKKSIPHHLKSVLSEKNIAGMTLSGETFTDDVLKRYDMESIFFNLLGTKDPLLHDKITEKVKYFDPAFHSITPEGFNARLTFLQQCMRAGQTQSAVEEGTATSNAVNSSFGRPPVCILRLGDFFETKIIISSVNISYDQWDLNTEGIGVQPMIANVQLSFNIIGGAEMGGPINRLQNALSFNYYKNTSVYDNRAEMIDYLDGFDESDTMVNFKGVKYTSKN